MNEYEKKLLEDMGFEPIHEGSIYYKHMCISDEIFDFSACSIMGTIKVVFMKGKEIGIRKTQDEIKTALGLYDIHIKEN